MSQLCSFEPEKPSRRGETPPIDDDFQTFASMLRDSGESPAMLSPRRFCAAMQLAEDAFAALAHVSSEKLHRFPTTPCVQNYLRQSFTNAKGRI